MSNTIRRMIFAAVQQMERANDKAAQELIEHLTEKQIQSCPSDEQGIYYWLLGKLEEQQQIQVALTYYEKSISTLQTFPDKAWLVRVMITKSKLLARTNNDQQALLQLQNAYEIAIYNCLPTENVIPLLFQLGTQHGKLGEFYSAIHFLQQALHYSEQIDLSYKVGQLYMALGICYMQLQQLHEAKNSFEQALLAFQLDGDEENLAGTQMNLGILYGHHHYYEQAIEAIGHAINHYQSLGNTALTAQCTFKLATYLYNDGDWDEAFACAKSILVDPTATTLHLDAHKLISNILKGKHQLAEAISHLEQAMDLAANDSSQQRRLIAKQAQLLHQLGKPTQALTLYAKLAEVDKE